MKLRVQSFVLNEIKGAEFCFLSLVSSILDNFTQIGKGMIECSFPKLTDIYIFVQQ